jgi:hypothetical protein
MTRILAVCCVLCAAAVLVHADMVTYYEDNFDGDALGPAWNVWGDGAYAVSGGNLRFVTAQGDFEPNIYPNWGAPHHMFLVSPPSSATQWTAVTRVRYNTPNQSFEQVNLLAFSEPNNLAKISYGYDGPGEWYHVRYSQQGGQVAQSSTVIAPYADYFWMRLERNGTTYTPSFSSDLTTNPDLVSWTVLGSMSNTMVNPMAGIAGWNAFGAPFTSGELAEFDYFRLQVVPEPSVMAATAAVGLTALGLRRRR